MNGQTDRKANGMNGIDRPAGGQAGRKAGRKEGRQAGGQEGRVAGWQGGIPSRGSKDKSASFQRCTNHGYKIRGT
jgi:hypothetical protein